MKPLEEKDVQSLVDLTLAHYHFQYLAAAVELELFTLLARNPGLTRQELGTRLEIQDPAMRTLLLCLGSVGLVRKDGDRYSNSPLADRYLTADHNDNLLSRVRLQQVLAYQGMSSFHESLKANTNIGIKHVPGHGPNLGDRISQSPVLQKAFREGMASFSRLHAVLGTIDLAGCERLLDVGGGPEAVNAVAFAKRWPRLRVTVLELPPVADLARKRVEESGLSERIEVIGTDCFKSEFPSGFDAILYAHFLPVFSVEKQLALVSKGARALKPKGRLIVLGGVENDDHDWHAAWLSAYFLTIVSGEGCVLTSAEFEKLCDEAGFEDVQETPLPEGDAFSISGIFQAVRRA